MVQKIFDLFQINFRANVEYITLIFFLKKKFNVKYEKKVLKIIFLKIQKII